MVSVNNTTQPATILKVFLAEANSAFFNKTAKNLVHYVLNAYIAQISLCQSQRNPLEKNKKTIRVYLQTQIPNQTRANPTYFFNHLRGEGAHGG